MKKNFPTRYFSKIRTRSDVSRDAGLTTSSGQRVGEIYPPSSDGPPPLKRDLSSFAFTNSDACLKCGLRARNIFVFPYALPPSWSTNFLYGTPRLLVLVGTEKGFAGDAFFQDAPPFPADDLYSRSACTKVSSPFFEKVRIPLILLGIGVRPTDAGICNGTRLVGRFSLRTFPSRLSSKRFILHAAPVDPQPLQGDCWLFSLSSFRPLFLLDSAPSPAFLVPFFVPARVTLQER